MDATGVGTEGGTFIPASQRPDGTWRKPRRVKEGYIPQEEVPLYESRGKQWAKTRSSYPVGLDPELIQASELKAAAKTNVVTTKKKKKNISSQPVPNPGAFDDYDSPGQQITTTSSSTTNVTIKVTTNKKKQQDQSSSSAADSNNKTKKGSADKKRNETTTTIIINEQSSAANNCNSSSSASDPLKRLRNLRKKLRDIEILEQKIKSKELKNPDKDQIEKVSRKANVQAEILAIEVELNLSTS